MNLSDLLKDEIPMGRFWNKAWSLVDGCTPISPGCKNCWLAVMEHRFGAKVEKGITGNLYDGTAAGYRIHTPSPLVDGIGAFNGKIRCRDDRLDIPLKRRKPTVYAVWSDLFHEEVPREFLLSAFATIARAKQHFFIIVTKRPQVAIDQLRKNGMFFPNVIVMVTMEDQQRADERLPSAYALSVNGWNVGILCEPLLGPVFMSQWLNHKEGESSPFRWIITGGESGPGARQAHHDWFRSLRDQAQAAGVPLLLKYIDKKHGRLLDEQEHDEVPEL